MLILSRRESEKVLFPNLGITIEVSRVQGRSVRLGIDAPDEIRIIRGELEDTADLTVKRKIKKPCDRSWTPPREVRKCLDAANLAIHLAQNQLRQQLTDNVEDALAHALQCLENLESAVGLGRESEELVAADSSVREAKTGYKRRPKNVAVLVDFDRRMSEEIKLQLNELGYQSCDLSSGKALIEFLHANDQPDLVLTVQDSFDPQEFSTESEPEMNCNLRMFGVGSLQRSAKTFSLGDSHITAWFASSADASSFADCFA